MRHTADRSARHHSVRVAMLVLVALAVCLVAAGVAAAASSDPVAGEAASPSPLDAVAASPVADPSPDPSPDPTVITCKLSKASLTYGDRVTVSGVVTPAVEGQKVTISLAGAPVATVLTDTKGAYTYTFAPRRAGSVVAVVADGTTADPVKLAVKPAVKISHGVLVPFLKTRFVVKVTPSAYTGLIVVRVVHRGVTVGTYKRRVQGGRAVFSIPLRGIDKFTLSFSMPSANGFTARRPVVNVVLRGRRLAAGSSGLYVKGLLTALQRLKIRVPGVGTRFTSGCKDAVMAFQKAYRLPRTYVFSGDDWRKLDRARTIKPKYKLPKTHIEVDKRRQILMVVKNGSLAGLICVSTGATGNTPEGAFHIQQKHPYTSSGFGANLFRTMGFLGNFAIHGWVPVPSYPASHGCVREPMWVANWVYQQSYVGERVFVYR